MGMWLSAAPPNMPFISALASRWVWNIGEMVICREKLKYLERNLACCHLVCHSSHMNCPGIEPESLWRKVSDWVPELRHGLWSTTDKLLWNSLHPVLLHVAVSSWPPHQGGKVVRSWKQKQDRNWAESVVGMPLEYTETFLRYSVKAVLVERYTTSGMSCTDFHTMNMQIMERSD